MSTIRTFFLMAALTLLLILVGQAIGGQQGAFFFFILSLMMNFIMYWFSDKIVLKMYRAKEVSQPEAPELHDIVRRLTAKAQMPMPKVYIIPQDAPNAFATGRNPQHAAVAVTAGIMRLLDREELEGVLGHELAHVKNRDVLTATIAASMAGAIMMLARMAGWSMMFGGMGGRDRDDRGGGGLGVLVMAIVAPLAAMLIQMAISRSREYAADIGGAQLAKPLALANALQDLDNYTKRIPMEVNPSTAHMFIVNPLSAKGIVHLFSTHPPIQERIKRLRAMA